MNDRPTGSSPGGPEQPALFEWEDTLPASLPDGGGFRDGPQARRMLDIREVYAEPAALASPRGRQIMARLPGVPVTEVAGHWRIPSLHGNDGNVARWTRVKTETLVLGVRQTLTTRPNGRSADWIAPGASNGCAMACAYCYVPRRKGYANPITLFTNIGAIVAHVRRHVQAQGPKREPNQCDPQSWVYDIGENGDCSVDALVSDNTADLIAAFRGLPTAKASFATKFVNPDLLALDPRGRTRVRFSVMPTSDSRLLDIRTSPVTDRIAAAADFLDAGYEVHFNLSPVVLRPGWQRDWADLLVHLDDVLPDRVKRQAAAEIIMLTHNQQLHEVNLGWHPRAEEVLWQPAAQETKRSENGALNVRYAREVKHTALVQLRELIAVHAPWLRIRYAF
ncbi:spore photoproduct lyase family protein [Streptomyces clavifer]|uniref:spore photoproduct lyase family protein n=1 Tax=Streptomyces clavifer TaxID=68188 RepID=UPI002E80D3DE|nr:spore photoproduct lyase family protein [Streptomyces clavifer]WRY82929.1 spore photoproduct lyase family protein [Streptomyces clavifer]WUC28689.1 spore photoproduct lyase family protein [Streptomyces clavifer]